MTGKIGSDVDLFRRKVKKLLRNDFKHLLNRGAIKVPRKNGMTKIPIDHIETPRFTYDDKQQKKIGQGDGEEGDPIGGDKAKGDRSGDGHGEGGGDPTYEEMYTREELADLLGEMLELPHEYDSDEGKILEVHRKYDSIRRVGPRSLRHIGRTYKQALKRTISLGGYVPGKPVIITPEDFRFKSSTDTIEEQSIGVFIHLMDASGSMESALDRAKILVDCTDLWLERKYKGIIHHYVHYSHNAYNLDRDTFFSVTASGGTDMATGLEHVVGLAEQYKDQQIDLYLEHITDGDYQSLSKKSMSGEERLLRALKDFILPRFTGVYVADIPTYPEEKRYSDFLYNRFGPGGWADGKLRVAPFASIDGIAEALQIFFQPLARTGLF